MKKVKEILYTLFSNFDVFIIFELVYHFFSFILTFCLTSLLDFSLKSIHLEYITHENIVTLFTQPFSIFAIILIILAICFYLYIQFAALTIYFDARDKRIKVSWFFKQTIRKCKRLLKLQNIGVIFLILGCSIFLYLCYSPQTFRIIIPEFIMEFMLENKVLFILYLGFLFFLFSLCIIFLPILYDFFIKEKSLIESNRARQKISILQFFKRLFQIIFYNVIFWAFLYIAYLVVTIILILFFKYIIHNQNHFWVSFQYGQSIFRFLNPILLISINLFLIYNLSISNKKEIPVRKRNFKIRSIGKWGVIIIVLIGFIGFSDSRIYNHIDYEKIQIISHRGGGIFAPENTIAGIQEAIDNGSDYAEIDVQVTKDGVLVLSHDSSLKRTARINQEISDLTYEELSKIDVGMRYKPEFRGEKIPTLEEVVSFSKNKIKLVIELKESQNNRDLVKKTIQTIEKYNREDDCVIASLQFSIIKEAKKINPHIKTAYIVAVAYGDLLSIKDSVDIYAFEPSYIDEQVLHNLKSMHKDIFVWTLNREKNIKQMLSLPIDGIITDNPYWTRYIMDHYNKDYVIQWLLNLFYP